MADYKKLYLEMMRASEKAIRILIEAQQKCEEELLAEPEERKIYLLPQEHKETL